MTVYQGNLDRFRASYSSMKVRKASFSRNYKKIRSVVTSWSFVITDVIMTTPDMSAILGR